MNLAGMLHKGVSRGGASKGNLSDAKSHGLKVTGNPGAGTGLERPIANLISCALKYCHFSFIPAAARAC